MHSGDHFFSLEQPLHTLPAHSQVSAMNLFHFPELINRLGGKTEALLERYGIDPRVLTLDNQFVDCQPFVELFEYCASEFNDPLFGFHLAELQSENVYGCVTALCKAAGTIRQGIHGLIDYLPVVHSTESLLELVEGNSISELRWTEHSDFGSNDQADGQGLVLNLKVLRAMAGSNFVPSYVNVSDQLYRKVGRELEKLVACPIRASKERSCIAFSSEILSQPSMGATRPLYQLLDSYLGRLKVSRKPDLLDQVKQFIARELGRGEFCIDACAKELGLSARSLQIRLRASHVSYSDILDSQRLERAKLKLRHSDLSIAEIADQLGYVERTSFGRAFKRWTGSSPQQYRLSN